MLALCVDATVEAVRESKQHPGKFYGEFIFSGGSGSYLLPSDDVQFYAESVGKSLQLLVGVRPQQIARFNRVLTVFEPVEVYPRKTN